MARDISVSIAVQGEKEFNQALKNAQSAVKVLASELKASEAAFDESADAQAYFANRTRIINDQIEQQRTILRSLEQAVREAGEEFGGASAKTDRYRIEINRTQASISKLEKELRETQREAEELGRDSTRVGRQIEDGLGEAADDVSDKLNDMTGQLEQGLGDIGDSMGFASGLGAIGAVGVAVAGAMEGLSGFVDETRETRIALSYLEQNAKDAGFDFEDIKDLLIDITGVTGDMDGAFEGISNLLATGFDERELVEAIDLLNGAVIRFPETMKFENLAESLQETIATGAATGAYGELLERLGVDIDEFNEAMARATTEEERQQIALAYLNEHGLAETTESWKESNEALNEANEAQSAMTLAMADLGEALQPAANEWSKFKLAVVQEITDLVTAYNTYKETQRAAFEEAKEVSQEAQKEAETFTSIDEFNEAIFQADAQGLYARSMQLQAAKEAFIKAQAEEQAAIRQAAKDEKDAAQTLGTSEEMTSKKSLWEMLFGGDDTSTVEAAQATSELVDEVVSTVEEERENMTTSGVNDIAEPIGEGIIEGTPEVVDAAGYMMTEIQREINRTPLTIPAPSLQKGSYNVNGTLKGGGNGMTGSSHVELVAQIDKTTVARATSGEINTLLGESAARAERYA